MTESRAEGFPPVYDERSRLLILGSFPSVKSREVCFYYGNPQNRFWRTVCGFFAEEVPKDIAGKREFLLRRRIALWDVAVRCAVTGSSDASIRDVVLSDVPKVLKAAPIEYIFCNGSKAYSMFTEGFPKYIDRTTLLPSTSPANPRFSAEAWERALSRVFRS